MPRVGCGRAAVENHVITKMPEGLNIDGLYLHTKCPISQLSTSMSTWIQYLRAWFVTFTFTWVLVRGSSASPETSRSTANIGWRDMQHFSQWLFLLGKSLVFLRSIRRPRQSTSFLSLQSTLKHFQLPPQYQSTTAINGICSFILGSWTYISEEPKSDNQHGLPLPSLDSSKNER